MLKYKENEDIQKNNDIILYIEKLLNLQIFDITKLSNQEYMHINLYTNEDLYIIYKLLSNTINKEINIKKLIFEKELLEKNR